jgi:lysozyme-like protein
MATLTREQIAALAQQAGFTGDDVKIAVAVALAESGGDPNDLNNNPVTRDLSYGLWQINMLGSLGPERRKEFGITSNNQLFDPATNARAAHIVWKNAGWNAWTTYTRGTYKKFLDGGSSLGNAVLGGALAAGGNPIGGAAVASGSTGSVSDTINNLASGLFKAASNFTGILVAIVLLVLGIVILAREPLKKAAPDIAKVAAL